MTISVQVNKSIKVTLTNVEETYVRARYFQLNAKKLGLANKVLSHVLDRDGNPVANFVMHDAIHQLFNLSTNNPDEKLVDMIGTHILYSIEPNQMVKSSLMAELVKPLLTGSGEDDAYYIYARLNKMGV